MIKINPKPKCKPEKLLPNNVPERDVELCLEVEMDDEVKDIITCPAKYGSTLLDVTVIKPKDIDKLYSSHKKTMSSDEVRKFIASMNLEGTGDDKKSQDTPKIHLAPAKDQKESLKSSGDHAKLTSIIENQKFGKFGDVLLDSLKKMYTTDETSSDHYSNERDTDKVKQIYTTPKTFLDLNKMFECKRKKKREQNEKLNTPCLCQNCAIVGVVTDSQKKPFATEMMYDPRETCPSAKKDIREEYKKRKFVNFKDSENHYQCQYYFSHLNEKIRNLEARIAVQEEKSVPKDYFKRIVTKLVSHITKLTTGSQIKIPSDSSQKKHRDSNKHSDKYNIGSKYVMNPILIDNKGVPPEKENFRPHKDSASTSQSANVNQIFLKWGEEILKPGIDLKNKIIVLMEDTLNNLKKSKEKTREEEIKHFVDEFSSNLYKTVHESPERDTKIHSRQECREASQNTEEINANRKRLTKIFNRKEEPVSVEYINSQILKWQDTQTTFKFESSDVDSMKAIDFKTDLYRADFMKTLLNTKEEDKLKLWHSIWKQASSNGQTREDKVTIQLPDKKDPKNRHIEILYSLGELEAMLKGKKTKIK
ncbi:uncharacterized protein [Leptinotarsa decemlineata]|uniref:uncharacterized protein n=1 Tax=Leptinotarsa decemlineata TaxID=7539 RepID=UPI003D304E06